MEVNELLTAIKRRVKERKLYSFKPYDYQKDFFAAGEQFNERMLMAANRVGKSYSAAYEVACHATGIYPDWWEGKKFRKGCTIWVGSVTNESSRDITQKELVGGVGEELGTGLIPSDLIASKPSMKNCGVPNVIDSVKVRHSSGELSNIVFKAYEQGWMKWQGTAPEVVWLDEEPRDYMIFSEAQTRIITSNGILIVTFTPLNGMTDLVRHFMEHQDDCYMKTATWDDVEHIKQEDKDRMKKLYSEHEYECRTKGIPMMGEGAVFPVSEDNLKCDPFKIPDHYARICGIDFGVDHPASCVWLAWDRDADIIYVYDAYKQRNESPVYHVAAIKKHGDWIPVAWPHDGVNREKGNNTPLIETYKTHKLPAALPMSARYENKKGGAQPTEPVIMEVLERIKLGKFKVFSSLGQWFEEYRNYHRKDGKLVRVMDDMLSATFYAMMMKRFAMPKYSFTTPEQQAPSRPTLSMR